MSKWEKWQVELIEKEYSKTPLDELAEKLGKTKTSLVSYANRHGLKTNRYLNAEQKEYIRKNYRKMNHEDIAKKIGFSRTTIEKFCMKEGLVHRWSDEEIEIMKSDYGVVNVKRIAKKLNRSYSSVRCMASRHGLIFKEMNGNLSEMDVAEVTGMPNWNVSRLVRKNELKGTRKGACVFIAEEELFKWMKQNDDSWKARDCDYYFFARFSWFKDKLKRENEERRVERWEAADPK